MNPKRERRLSIIKYNSGEGALLCNGCKVIITEGFDHEDRLHYCDDCKRKIKFVWTL